MSRHEAPKKSKATVESKEMQAAILRNELRGIEADAGFLATFGHLDNSALAQRAHEMDMLGFKLRHLLWLRQHEQFKGN